MSLIESLAFAYAGVMLNNYAKNIPDTKNKIISTSNLTINLLAYFDNRAKIIRTSKRTYSLKVALPEAELSEHLSELEINISNHEFSYSSKDRLFEGKNSIKIPLMFSFYVRALLSYYSE